MPAKYPKLKRALANSGTNAQSTIVTATACQKSGCPGVLLWSTTVIDRQVMRMRTTSSGICHASPPAMPDWLGIFMAVAFSIERDKGRQCRHDEQVEFLDDEAERDGGDTGANPGQERSLVRGVIGISVDHSNLACRL